ncbi:MAG: hypothetical protein AAGE01_09030 [Pseudomonadota bacterium]
MVDGRVFGAVLLCGALSIGETNGDDTGDFESHGGDRNEAGQTAVHSIGGDDGVISSLATSGCETTFSTDRAMVHFNTSLGIMFTDPAPSFKLNGTIGFDFPPGFSGEIPNPDSRSESGVTTSRSITDNDHASWGNFCWKYGEGATGGSAHIESIDGPAGIVRAVFDNFQLADCETHGVVCTLTGVIESRGTGVFETADR